MDRRELYLHLTGAGQRVVDECLPAIHGAISQALVQLTERERKQLLAALVKIRDGTAQLANQTAAPKRIRRKRRPRPTD